jgi:hypothetical protein
VTAASSNPQSIGSASPDPMGMGSISSDPLAASSASPDPKGVGYVLPDPLGAGSPHPTLRGGTHLARSLEAHSASGGNAGPRRGPVLSLTAMGVTTQACNHAPDIIRAAGMPRRDSWPQRAIPGHPHRLQRRAYQHCATKSLYGPNQGSLLTMSCVGTK